MLLHCSNLFLLSWLVFHWIYTQPLIFFIGLFSQTCGDSSYCHLWIRLFGTFLYMSFDRLWYECSHASFLIFIVFMVYSSLSFYFSSFSPWMFKVPPPFLTLQSFSHECVFHVVKHFCVCVNWYNLMIFLLWPLDVESYTDWLSDVEPRLAYMK